MNKLADLEICKRIAEIEGLMFCTGNRYARIEIWKDRKVYKYEKYNPLTDDALCFKLMVKYSVRVEPENCSAWTDNDDGYPQYEVIHCEGTINKAICLAIIAAKVGKQ